jgi:hypothetical protein
VVEGRSSAGVLPSEEEGLKRSQSRRSSPDTAEHSENGRSSPDTAEHSENGAASGFSGGLGVGGWRWWTASGSEPVWKGAGE